jgi:hypothetical protein
MKRILVSLISIGTLAALLVLGGCSKREESGTAETNPSPAASPGVAASRPTMAAGEAKLKGDLAAVKGDLALAKDNLEQAARELESGNHRRAVDHLNKARADIASARPDEPAKNKTGLEAAVKELDSVRTMIEKNERGAKPALARLISNVEKLSKRG